MVVGSAVKNPVGKSPTSRSCPSPTLSPPCARRSSAYAARRAALGVREVQLSSALASVAERAMRKAEVLASFIASSGNPEDSEGDEEEGSNHEPDE